MKIQTKRYIRLSGTALFLIYIGILFYLLFFSADYNRDVVASGYRYNFIPFKEIMRFWNNRDSLGMGPVMVNIIGNIVAFIPFGFFIPIISSKLSAGWKVILLGLLLSLSVEFLQLVTKVGSCDVDDLILNTFGTIVGYLLFRICSAIWRRTYGKEI